MDRQQAVASALAALGVVCVTIAIANERRMQRHRRPGVSYGDATFRRDGGWKRTDLFDPPAFAYQRRASAFGVAGALCWIAALIAWALLGSR